MKNSLVLILLFFSSLYVKAQNNNVGIGTTSPNASSLLELSSTSKGFLFPRMTYSQRNAINTPVPGLMIFQTNSGGVPIQSSGVYIYDGSNWKRLARFDEIGGGGTTGWTVAGDDQYSNLTGNVGIGTTSPTSKFHVVGNILQQTGTYTMNHSSALLQFQNAGVNRAYVQLSGTDLRLGTNSNNTAGRTIFRMNAEEYMMIDSTGDVGIGTMSPDRRLHVNGGSIQVTHAGTTLNQPNAPVVNFELTTEDEKKGGLKFIRDGNTLAELLYVIDDDGPNYMRVSANGPNLRDFLVNTNGRTGINMNGTNFEPKGQLHVRADDGVDAIVLHSAEFAHSPTIQFYNTAIGTNALDKKAFIQLSDSEDLRMGTNSANGTGKIVWRMDQQDRAWFDSEGRFGLGTEYPLAKLTIHGGQDADLNPSVGNGYIMLGELTSNLILDNNEIMARNSLDPGTLYVQQDGGLLKIGDGTAATGTKVQITGGEGSSLSGHGYMVLGAPTSQNITMDVNEIQARSNGGGSTLFLQRSGGTLDIGGHTTLSKSGSGEVLKLDGTNPNIGFYQSGAYKSFISQSGSELFMGVNGGRLHLDATQIAIGGVNTANDVDQFKLTVSGKVICEELKVELYANWPDYVFAKEYDLKPLHELKSFIETNHHLPNIPKASEVARDGFEVGEMNRKLLEKVEELTLYVIQLHEEMNELKSQVKGNK